MKPNNLLKPEVLIKGIIIVNAVLFVVSLVISGKEVHFTMDPFSALSPSNNSLVFLGAAGTISMDRYHEWWSLISASWLHGSLLHILFNMLALRQIGPFIIRAFGASRMFIIYFLSGVIGFFLSYLAGILITIGASAAICGLIGSALYYGKSRGGAFGQAVYKQTSGWVFGIFLCGFLIPNINNWGHGGGLVGGIALGWLLGYHEKNRETVLHKTLAFLFAAFTLAILAWAVLSAVYLRFF